MENPRRTAEHLDRIARRQDALREFTSTFLARFPTFTLEIGCGHGHFLTAYATARPTEICLGLDLIAERIARANRKKTRARLDRLHFVHASAEDFLAVLPPAARLSAVFILFPDPWPKRRHHKNRIMQSHFLETLSTRALPETRLYFRTDDNDYFRATTTVIRSHSRWQIGEELWPFEHDTVFQQRAPAYQSLVARPKPAH